MSTGIADKKTLGELFGYNSEKTYDLTIPYYQRPYSWNIKKQVDPLLNSLREHHRQLNSKNNGVPYIMGTIILYQNKDNGSKYEIVDGQQRLTTFAILLYCLGKSEKNQNPLLEQKYEHSESVFNIVKNRNFIDSWLKKEGLSKDNGNGSQFAEYLIGGKIQFVIVKAETLDDAFIFFDSQNSRGKPLHPHDLIKAHHLRYIASEEVQKSCAKTWEQIERNGETPKKSPKMEYLITALLGRPRAWTRMDDIRGFDIRNEFKSQRITKKGTTRYKLNHYHQPPVFTMWQYTVQDEDEGKGLELFYRDIDAMNGTKRLQFMTESKKYMPFQMNQPLEGGEQFFWYIEKYHALYCELFGDDEQKNKNIPQEFFKLDKAVKSLCYNKGVEFLNELYEACILFYYDKFGLEDFMRIVMWLEHGIFFLRVLNSSIFASSIPKYVREKLNPIKIIHEAAFPEHIVNEIRKKVEDWKSIQVGELKKNSIRSVYNSTMLSLYEKNVLTIDDIQKEKIGILWRR